MGQLTNLYVSQSYQGLLKMTDSANGLTSTLQTVQTGDGDNSPLQMSLTAINISGSFTVNGLPVAADTGSLVTTSSFNAYTSSVNTQLAGLNIETGSLQNQINGLASTGSLTSLSSSIAVTDLAQDGRLTSLEGITGSLQNQINQKLDTGSFNTYTSSVNSKLAGLDIETGSLQNQINGLATTSSLTSLSSSIATTDLNQNNVIAGLATTSSLTSLSSSIASTDLAQNNRLTSLEGVTGSINRNGLITTGSIGTTQGILGDIAITGSLSAYSASITYLQTIYETASVIYSSGSNQFGDASDDIQILYGKVVLPNGPLDITGSVTSSAGFNGNLQGTASYATQALSASYAPQTPLPSGLVSGSSQISYTGITDVPSGIISGSVQISNLGFATTSSVIALTGSINSLNAATSSFVTETESGSFVTNVQGGAVSFEDQIIVTKGDGTTNTVTVNNVTNADSASYATNALTASFALNIAGGLINTGSFATTGSNIFLGNQTLTGSFNQTGSMNVIGNPSNPSATIARFGDPGFGVVDISGNGQLIATNNIGVTNIQNWNTVGSSNITVNNTRGDLYLNPKSATGSVILGINQSSKIEITGSLSVSGSNVINGNQTITGSLLGSALNDGQIRIFSDAFNSGAVKMNITSSNAVSQSNIIFGFAQGPALVQFTGSIVISGSNNIVMGGPRPNTLVTQGTYGYLGGNFNIFGGQSTLNTGSSYRPLTNSNINFGTIGMTLGSGSANFNLTQNALFGGNLVINMPSASIGGTMSTNIIAGTVTLQQTQAITSATSSISPSFNTNNVNGTFTLQTNSGSFQVLNNNINGNNIQVTSSYRATTVASNAITLNNNSINGLNHRILFDGVAATSKGLNNSLIVGANNTASMVGNDTNGISNTGLIGQGLHVESGTISGTGGSLIVGRYNGTGSLSNPGFIKFAVGTGNSDTNRRTSLWVDDTSKVSVSGSLDISGSVNISGSQLRTNNYIIYDGSPNEAGPMTNFVSSHMVDKNTFSFTNIVQSQLSSGSNFGLQTNTGSTFTQINFKSAYAGTETQFTVGNFNGSRNIDFKTDTMNVTGSLNVTGSVTIQSGSGDLFVHGNKQFNVGAFASTQTQSGSANVSQSITYDTTDYSQGVTYVSGSRLTVANKGVYNIQFSAQIDRVAGSGTDTVYIWLKKNGTNVTGSAGSITIAGAAAAAKTISSWNYVVDSAANDYYELVWQPTDSNIHLTAATATGNIPSIPSIITTVTQVR